MDFRDTPEDARFRGEVRSWLERNLPADRPIARGGKMEDDDEWFEFMQGWAKKLAAAGYAGLAWPKEFGGAGSTVRQQLIFDEEISRADGPFHVDIVGIGMAGPTLMAYGSHEQKRLYLPSILDGSDIWCQLWSEPNAGSDLAAVRTRAVRKDDRWIVTGQKVWTTMAHRCRRGLLIARSDPLAPKHAGLTYFIMDMKAPGVTVRPLRGMEGDNEFSEVFLDDVVVSDSERLGQAGEGWKVMGTSLMLERFAIGGGAINYPDDFRAVVELTHRLGMTDEPLVRQELTKLYTETVALRVLGYRLMTSIDAGDEPGPEGSILKLLAAEFNVRLHEFAMWVAGRDGLDEDSPIARRFLRSRGSTIEGGTSEIQRNILGERVLGLPREPKPASYS